MKKIILSLSLLITGAIYAYNPSIEFRTTETLQVSKTNDRESVACRVSCYARITHADTGESHTFYASATNDLCGVASAMCQSRALARAMAYISTH
ncbi:hypothetical protein [Confluentibacter citreus]|uniref:hypothetical protein n=1 Tax=Confluentibacter citreus TaxID=2007307 RepID=UPI0012FD82A7|nr:hypothetical protein [Confluentibacter citreus]